MINEIVIATSMPEVVKDIVEITATMSDKHRKIIEHRFGLITGQPMLLKDIAPIFKISKERIRAIETKVMRKLRERGHFKKV